MKPLSLVVLGLVPTVHAQVLNEHCTSVNDTDVTFYQRQGGVGSHIAYTAVFPRRNFRAWGHDAAMPGTHRVDGLRAILADVDGSTAERVTFGIYPEDPQNAGFPDFANAAGAFNYPLFGTGAAGTAQAFVYDIAFPSTVHVADYGDVFVDVLLTPTSAPETYVSFISGDTIANENYDISNARVAETGHGLGNGGFFYQYDFTPPVSGFFGEGQLMIGPLVADQPGLALAATTNQVTMPGSNAPGMTSSFHSALQPCEVADRNGAARADDIGWFWNDGRFTSGEPVQFMMAASGFAAAPIDLDSLLSGSSGALCLDVATPWATVGLGVTDSNGFANAQLALPATARGSMSGLDFVYTAILLDFANAQAHASGCNKQLW